MRWRGLANAHLQAGFTATAYNLTRTANLLAAGSAFRPRQHRHNAAI